MPEQPIDNDAAVRDTQSELKHFESKRRIDSKMNRETDPTDIKIINQIRHHLALVEAARGLANAYAGHAAIRPMGTDALDKVVALLPSVKEG